jgi:hypothetical protein
MVLIDTAASIVEQGILTTADLLIVRIALELWQEVISRLELHEKEKTSLQETILFLKVAFGTQ